jgi:hypothetical protein
MSRSGHEQDFVHHLAQDRAVVSPGCLTAMPSAIVSPLRADPAP